MQHRVCYLPDMFRHSCVILPEELHDAVSQKCLLLQHKLHNKQKRISRVQRIHFFQELSPQSLKKLAISQAPMSESISELDMAYHFLTWQSNPLVGEAPTSQPLMYTCVHTCQISILQLACYADWVLTSLCIAQPSNTMENFSFSKGGNVSWKDVLFCALQSSSMRAPKERVNLVFLNTGETGNTQKNLSSFEYGRKRDEERGKNLLHFSDHKRNPNSVIFLQSSKTSECI
jgi:hypothetical protein